VYVPGVSATDPTCTALVLGGGSDIAWATLRSLAGIGLRHVVLAGRDDVAITARLADDPLGVERVSVERWDALDTAGHATFLASAAEQLGGRIDLVLCAVGSLGHGSGQDADPVAVRAVLDANFTGPASALTAAAAHLRVQGSGTIVVLSSVAGLRARRSNFPYGSAKAGLDAFSAGLADSCHGTPVRVHVVRPGFVRTKMTTGLPPAPFATDPERVAAAIVAAVGSTRSRVVHVPPVLGPLFGALRLAPRPIWRRIAGDR